MIRSGFLRRVGSVAMAGLLLGTFVAPLRAAENVPPAGFTALFNGKNLDGWQGVVPLPELVKGTDADREAKIKAANAKVLPHWTVNADGVLVYDGKGDSLQTTKFYGDFELLVDWKIGPAGDSGIYLRGQPQVQIWDSTALTGGLAPDKDKGSGGLWNNPAGSKGKTPLKNADKPVGEWNRFRILVQKSLVTVYLNGELVVENEPLMNFWERGKPVPATGPIELQHHGNPLYFKNIFIKELK
ncbi:3-keto-disaccharide hydrolase [Tuwongella immobilis]|uniref:3-keto-alpha-glucoside-1,2-lyase/3-keto-2-hydroxy-glucal hydratase domain-containing protein n=1 Tax=Tuwongella immobilis TaxID=692036 RepID=A0A6C2YRC2_9BACT|nr:DUF1080 domain-containing protein [Tuwongella immobilis]VIP04036.1 Uncharacterized protein OS=Planctomyces maris DSM 8797 GN=PM8797T_11786 PE=4 SV=1: DUF1080 [Tuwongella immobilis]VTS05439.1 Uncharacterized protein OS=Planctomyces maris DSM 8797 GN=PM8797T_11786 PE=4 SV=1: DUF1080 [Tuwongella immobilis]